jgi:hypothetical protein
MIRYGHQGLPETRLSARRVSNEEKFFFHLLEDVLELVEVNGGVVAHYGDGCNFFQGRVVGALDLSPGMEELTDGFVGGSGEFELVELLLVLEGEHLADGHHVGGQGARLIRADDGGAAEGFDGRERPEKNELRMRWVLVHMKKRSALATALRVTKSC